MTKCDDSNDKGFNCIWIPAFAGMTDWVAGMTEVVTGMTKWDDRDDSDGDGKI